MTSEAPTRAYRRLSVEERRSQLLDAALELFAHNAPEDVSLDDVAEAAGVSRPLVYRYFPGGKQQLYEAALRSSADELELCFVAPQTGPLTRRLACALDRYLAFVDEHDAGFAALLRGGSVGRHRVASPEWILEMRTGGRSEPARGTEFGAGYPEGFYHNQWWMTGDASGAFYGVGIYGQFLWLDPGLPHGVGVSPCSPIEFPPNGVTRIWHGDVLTGQGNESATIGSRLEYPYGLITGFEL